ncbi:hypothetical protein [Anatilimnocola floriformis]|uniref:hypothetical protein n=1 Tax=Anatilimnocola floriformis TaxID=2948575 RepID=UPI0020C50B68|nr:hypothetical protein [Anatilimnocola floriformis]
MEIAALLIIPIATAAAVAALGRWLLPGAFRYVLPVAIAAGFAAGCFLFPDRLPLIAERYWHWLPYVALIAAVFGAVTAARGERAYDLPFWLLVLGFIAAWLIVPRYPDLKPSRPWSLLLVTTYLAGITWLLTQLPERLRGRLFLAILTLTALATTVLVTAEVSLRIGTVALRGPLAMLGCQLVPRLFAKSNWDQIPRELLGVISVFAILAGGSAYIGAVELSSPHWLLLVVPAAPLVLWLFAFGPLSRLKGATSIIAQLVAVALVPLAIVLWIFLHAEPDEWG